MLLGFNSIVAQTVDVSSQLKDIRGPVPLPESPNHTLWILSGIIILLVAIILFLLFKRDRKPKPLSVVKRLSLATNELLSHSEEVQPEQVEVYLHLLRLHLDESYGYPISFDMGTLAINIRKGPHTELVPVIDNIEALELARFGGQQFEQETFTALVRAVEAALNVYRKNQK